jgi:hypothetical protein
MAHEELGQAIDAVYDRLARGALQPSDLVEDRAVTRPTPRRYIRHFCANRTVYEEDARVIGRFGRSDGTILDIGAHWGYMAASFRHAGAGGPILSFEPMRAHHGCLDELRRIDGSYDFSPEGLSDSETAVTLYGPVVNGQAILGLNSVDGRIFNAHHREHLLSLLGTEIPLAPRYEFKLMVTRLVAKRLDDVLASRRYFFLKPFLVPTERIAVMKLDVEGHEPAVLRGAEATLSAHRPFIMVESGNRNAEVAAILTRHGYRYAERDGDVLKLTDAHSTAANGFWFHADRATEYRAKGILQDLQL